MSKKKSDAENPTFEEVAAESATLAHAEKHPPRKFFDALKTKLTSEELLERGASLAAALGKVAMLEDEKKAAAERIKARITEVQGEADDLAGVIRTGVELREGVECVETFYFENNTATVTRSDTGEIVSTRALRASELQAVLPLMQGESDEHAGAEA